MHKLERSFVEKVWGVDALPAIFNAPSGVRIGEVWYDPPTALDTLLVKALFASERLSIQAHPSDAQAQSMGLGLAGKSECWVITDAEEGATIAVGFKDEISPEEMKQSALDGSIVDLMVWHEVRRGDAFYIPAGTVHAIGGGVSLIEIQQNTDITFRLYDYGRPRELHLDEAMQVSATRPYSLANRKRVPHDRVLVDSEHFQLAAVAGPDFSFDESWAGRALTVPFEGAFEVDGQRLVVGECGWVDSLTEAAISGDGILLIAKPA